jgi:hypothetical protein
MSMENAKPMSTMWLKLKEPAQALSAEMEYQALELVAMPMASLVMLEAIILLTQETLETMLTGTLVEVNFNIAKIK